MQKIAGALLVAAHALLLACIASMGAHAAEIGSPQQVANKRYDAVKQRCAVLSGIEMGDCFGRVMTDLLEEQSMVLKEASAAVNSMWGASADTEIRSNLEEGQQAWAKYVEAHCSARVGYYSQAEIHPPSQGANIEACRVRKTIERIEELKADYINIAH